MKRATSFPIGGVAFFLGLLIACGAWADGIPVRFAGVEESLSIILSDGKKTRLHHLYVPKEFKAAAEQKLEQLSMGGDLVLHKGAYGLDRHGRIPARLTTADGIWLDEALLESGLAVFVGNVADLSTSKRLWEAELVGRNAGAGLWKAALFGPHPVGRANDQIGRFALIEGRVLGIANIKGRLYLNFGKDWRTDFTLSIATKTADVFTAQGWPLASLQGRLVRARGFVEKRNGPMITLDHVGQLEVVE